MKVLFVANRVPFPPFRGDKLKIFNLAMRLKSKHELHLITIAETKEDLNYKAELEKIFAKVTIIYLPKWKSMFNTFWGIFRNTPFQVSYFRSLPFKKLLERTIEAEKFDAIHVQHIRMGSFFENLNTKNAILDLPDAFSLYWKRRSMNAKHWYTRVFTRWEYKRLLKYENYLLPKFPLNLVCSEEDKAYLMENTKATIEVLPNGVDNNIFKPNEAISILSNRILFTGNMDYAPNVDAAEYFCSEIFPMVLSEVPDAEFIIAGQRPVARVLKLVANNVIVTGFVENIANEYAKAAVVIAPLRFGAGTQNKVLEALAVGVPVVCTKVGFKGLGIESGEGAVLANDSESFAKEIVKIMKDTDYRNTISKAGGDTISKRFSWDAISIKLDEFLNGISKNT